MRLGDIGLAVLAAIVWGLVFVAIKFGVARGAAVPAHRRCVRLRGLFRRSSSYAARRRAGPLVVLYGLLIGVGQFGLLFLAIRLGMPVGLASLLMQLQAFITIGLAWVVLGERPTRTQGHRRGDRVCGRRRDRLGAAWRRELLPFALTLIAVGFCWALGNLVSKLAGKIDAFAFVVWSSLVAPVPMLALSLLLEPGRRCTRCCIRRSSLALSRRGARLWRHAASASASGAGCSRAIRPRTSAPFALLVPVVGMASAWLAFRRDAARD